MPEIVTLLRIFVASPSDVNEERNVLKAVVDELNHSLALPHGLFLFLLQWEADVYPGFGADAQDVVNRQLDSADVDLFVGILWKRFGTPTHRADSGTEEEFNRAYERWQITQRPHLMLYFNKAAITPTSREEVQQYDRVLAFKEQVATQGGLHWEYEGVSGFKETVRRHLIQFINRTASVPASARRVMVLAPNQPTASPQPVAAGLGDSFGKEAMLRRHRFSVYSLAFNHDDTLLVSGDREGAIIVWNMKTHEVTKSFKGHLGTVNSLAFSTDGRVLASGSSDYVMKLWDVESEIEIATINGYRDVAYIAFSPDSRILARPHDSTIQLRDIITYDLIAELRGHNHNVNALAFTPDGHLLVSGDDGGTIKLWTMKTHEEIKTLTAHAGRVRCLAISPDGSIAVSAGDDSTVKVWDARTWQQIGTLEHAEERTTCLTFSHDGRYLASSTLGGIIFLWRRDESKPRKKTKRQSEKAGGRPGAGS